MITSPLSTARRGWPRALWVLCGATFIIQTGYGTILPLLPIYAERRGFSLPWIGAMAALYALASFVGQWVLGNRSDVLGRRLLLMLGAGITAIATALFVLRVPAPFYLGFRILQGIGAAAFLPAANALVGDLVSDARRGSAYGFLSSASMAGFALGPLVGGILSSWWGLSAPFVLGAVFAGLAMFGIMRGLPSGRTEEVHSTEREAPISGSLYRVLWPLFVVNFGWTGLIGMYDTVWSLYMRFLGASNLVVGLSFTCFAIPLLLSNFVGGRLANARARRNALIFGGSLLNAGTVFLYIASRSVWLSIVVSIVEAISMSLIGPALQAQLMNAIPQQMRGTVQGRFQAVGTLGSLVMAIASGLLMIHSIRDPFWAGAGLLVLTTVVFGLTGLRAPEPRL